MEMQAGAERLEAPRVAAHPDALQWDRAGAQFGGCVYSRWGALRLRWVLRCNPATPARSTLQVCVWGGVTAGWVHVVALDTGMYYHDIAATGHLGDEYRALQHLADELAATANTILGP